LSGSHLKAPGFAGGYLLYVTIRSIAAGQVLMMTQAAMITEKHLIRIMELLGDDTKFLGTSEADKELIGIQRVKIYIDLTFLWIISLFCLLSFFTDVSH
jgi:hypothetical protein